MDGRAKSSRADALREIRDEIRDEIRAGFPCDIDVDVVESLRVDRLKQDKALDERLREHT